jgi:hypothetical protein
MKIKLNTKHIAVVAQGLKETDRKNFDLVDVGQVFKMLQYWAKTAGAGKAKIQSVTELPDGFLCRVNRKFHDMMKTYIKEIGSKRFGEQVKEMKVRDTLEKYDRLIQEAEDEKFKSDKRKPL